MDLIRLALTSAYLRRAGATKCPCNVNHDLFDCEKESWTAYYERCSALSEIKMGDALKIDQLGEMLLKSLGVEYDAQDVEKYVLFQRWRFYTHLIEANYFELARSSSLLREALTYQP